MYEDILHNKNQKLQVKQQNISYNNNENYPQKLVATETLKKHLLQIVQLNKEKQQYLLTLQKQLKQIQLEQQILQSNVLKSELQFQTLKLENLEKKHKFEQQKDQQQQQNQMDLNSWLSNVQKYNGLPQQMIDQLLSMEYEGNPGDQICLACYKEMETGNMSKYLPCSHLFHSQCIDQHLKISKVCPACMQEVIV